MGQYYSLHDARARQWNRDTLDAVEKTMGAGQAAPSIWAGVPFNPMLQNRQFLLERGFPDPLVPKWGNLIRAPSQKFELEIARSSEVFVLVTCDVETAHMYTAILFSGRWERHTYWRVGSTTELVPNVNVKFGHMEKAQAQRAQEEKMARSGMLGRDMAKEFREEREQSAAIVATRRRSKQRGYQAELLSGSLPQYQSQYESPSRRQNSMDAPSFRTEPDEVAAKRMLHRTASAPQPLDGLTNRTQAAWGSVYDKDPWMRSQWEHVMLYSVVEGVLGHFADNLDACAASMGAIISSAGGKPTVCLAHRVGTLAVTDDLVATINADMRREFAVKTEDHLLRQSTNCTLFVMRVLRSLNLPLRGGQLTEAAAQHPKLGREAGQVLGQAWEYLWNRVDP
jgi:hypothetical protein